MRFLFARLFPIPFLVVGILILTLGVKSFYLAKDSMSWPSAVGLVEFSSVEQRRNDDSTTYEAEILYHYEVEGVVYSSNRISFGNVSTSNPNEARRFVNEFPVDSEVTVFYSAGDPEKSVLKPGVHAGTYFMPIFGLIFALCGIGMFIFLPKAIKKTPKSKPTLEPFKPKDMI